MPDDPIARTSALLRALADAAPERVSLGAIGDALGTRRPGIAVLCLALPNCIPGPYVPGLSTVLALPMIWIGAQLALRTGVAQMPRFFHRITFSRERFVRFVDRVAPWMIRMEQRVGPRPSALTTPLARRCLGLVLILYAIVLALPIPFGNIPIGFGVAILALGLIESDSRALGWGLAIGVGGILWQIFLVTLGIKAITAL
ncbi:MAG TPA: exopolysaccharide biosynthesis protein [Stellaceae bacterium]|jgi:hypothetical protein